MLDMMRKSPTLTGMSSFRQEQIEKMIPANEIQGQK